MSSADLASWLLEQIAEDERMARQLERRAQEYALHIQDPTLLGRVIPGWYDWPDVEAMAHRVLAECEAKRRIVEAHPTIVRDDEIGCLTCHSEAGYTYMPGYCDTLKAIALPFADRPGYREEWRP